MDQSTSDTLRAAEEAVNRLVEACRKNSPLYARNPKVVAQASRTGKRHLNAITAPRKVLDTPCTDDGKQAS